MSNFVEIDLVVREKKNLKVFFIIYWHGGHVPWIIYKHIGSPFQQMLHVKFGFDWQRGFREEEL